MADDMVGKRIGRLTVMYQVPAPEGSKRRDTWWHCKCDCGNEIDRPRNNIGIGKTTSCGCYAREVHRAIAHRRKMPVDDKSYVQNNTRTLTYESVCPECKKTFERLTAEWGWKIKDKRYCSYKCMRAVENRENEKKRRMENARKDKKA